MDVTHYQVLGVNKDASEEEIKQAYRQKAKELHPDRGSGTYQEDTTQLFQQVTEAYEILSDLQKRTEYDRKIMLKPHTLSESTLKSESLKKLFGDNDSFLKNKLASTESYPRSTKRERLPTEEEPALKRHCNGHSNILPPLSNITKCASAKSMPNLRANYTLSKSAEFSPMGALKPPTPTETSTRSQSPNYQGTIQLRGHNFNSLASLGSFSNLSTDITALTIETILSISFEESVTGCQKQVLFSRKEPCSCGQNSSQCDICSGSGLVTVNASTEVSVPAGVINGCKKRLVDEGHSSPTGRKGDLILTVNVGNHPFLRRRGQVDVECDLPVSFIHATLGVTLQIPSIRGQIRVCCLPVCGTTWILIEFCFIASCTTRNATK